MFLRSTHASELYPRYRADTESQVASKIIAYTQPATLVILCSHIWNHPYPFTFPWSIL